MQGKLSPCAGEMDEAGFCLPVGEVSSSQSNNKDDQERQREGKDLGHLAESPAF